MTSKIVIANELATEFRNMDRACQRLVAGAIDDLGRRLRNVKFSNAQRVITEVEIEGIVINFTVGAEQSVTVLGIQVANDDETNIIRLESHARFAVHQPIIVANIRRRASRMT